MAHREEFLLFLLTPLTMTDTGPFLPQGKRHTQPLQAPIFSIGISDSKRMIECQASAKANNTRRFIKASTGKRLFRNGA